MLLYVGHWLAEFPIRRHCRPYFLMAHREQLTAMCTGSRSPRACAAIADDMIMVEDSDDEWRAMPRRQRPLTWPDLRPDGEEPAVPRHLRNRIFATADMKEEQLEVHMTMTRYRTAGEVWTFEARACNTKVQQVFSAHRSTLSCAAASCVLFQNALCIQVRPDLLNWTVNNEKDEVYYSLLIPTQKDVLLQTFPAASARTVQQMSPKYCIAHPLESVRNMRRHEARDMRHQGHLHVGLATYMRTHVTVSYGVKFTEMPWRSFWQVRHRLAALLVPRPCSFILNTGLGHTWSVCENCELHALLDLLREVLLHTPGVQEMHDPPRFHIAWVEI